jgi:hypothetical protein
VNAACLPQLLLLREMKRSSIEEEFKKALAIADLYESLLSTV